MADFEMVFQHVEKFYAEHPEIKRAMEIVEIAQMIIDAYEDAVHPKPVIIASDRLEPTTGTIWRGHYTYGGITNRPAPPTTD